MRASGSWGALALASAVVVGCSTAPNDTLCRDGVSEARGCGIDLELRDCGLPEWNCKYSCYGGQSCRELNNWFDHGTGPLALRACFHACNAKSCGDGTTVPGYALCDGVLDCADGRDEAGCTYLMCPDGKPVHLEYGYCPADLDGSVSPELEDFSVPPEQDPRDEDAGSALEPMDVGDNDGGR